CREASERRTLHQDVALAPYTHWLSQEPHERVAGFLCAGSRAWLVVAARPVHLTRSDPRQADVRAFAAPHRTVAVINCGRGAIEAVTGGNDRGGEEGEDAHCRVG